MDATTITVLTVVVAAVSFGAGWFACKFWTQSQDDADHCNLRKSIVSAREELWNLVHMLAQNGAETDLDRHQLEELMLATVRVRQFVKGLLKNRDGVPPKASRR